MNARTQKNKKDQNTPHAKKRSKYTSCQKKIKIHLMPKNYQNTPHAKNDQNTPHAKKRYVSNHYSFFSEYTTFGNLFSSPSPCVFFVCFLFCFVFVVAGYF